MLTAETITDEQIRELHRTADGKAPLTAWCDEALGVAVYQRGVKNGFARIRCADAWNSRNRR